MTPAQEAALETPVLSSRFELRRKLGEGAFGTVYEAVDRQNGCTVALKQLRRTNAENLSLVKQEFRSLVDIAHPNLVALYELLASDEGDWLLLMEFIDGVDFLSFVSSTTPPPETSQASERAPLPISGTDPTLDGLIPQDLVATIVSKERSGSIPRTGSLPSFHDRVFIQSGAPLSHDYGVLRSTPVVDFARLQQAMLQLATGLVALHSAGKLHRDLKPSNIHSVEKLLGNFLGSSEQGRAFAWPVVMPSVPSSAFLLNWGARTTLSVQRSIPQPITARTWTPSSLS